MMKENATKGLTQSNEIEFSSNACKGDARIHFESKLVPTTKNLCWTIKEFSSTVARPKLFKSYVLEFNDTVPNVKFTVGETKNGIVYLQPIVDRKDFKKYGKLFVKYGFSVGPHTQFNQDFTLESPTVQVKGLNKSRLTILESKLLQHSYLVNGNLNLIIRFTSFTASTSAAVEDRASFLGSGSGDLVQNCSQFAMLNASRPNLQHEVPKGGGGADIRASFISEPFSGINDTEELQSALPIKKSWWEEDSSSVLWNWSENAASNSGHLSRLQDLRGSCCDWGDCKTISDVDCWICDKKREDLQKAGWIVPDCNQGSLHSKNCRTEQGQLNRDLKPYKSSVIFQDKTKNELQKLGSSSKNCQTGEDVHPLYESTPVVSSRSYTYKSLGTKTIV